MSVAETPRLSLQRLTLEDAPFIVRLLNDADFLRYVGDRAVRSVADAESYLRQGPLGSYARHGFGLYRVALAATGEAVGMCGILQRDYLDAPDLGFALLPEYRRQGFTAEAATAVMAHGRRDFNLTRILAITSLDNESSMRLLAKLGFVLERRVRRVETEPELNLFAISF